MTGFAHFAPPLEEIKNVSVGRKRFQRRLLVLQDGGSLFMRNGF